jgi:hypothetical protein
MRAAIEENLKLWYERMLSELDRLPAELEEMGQRCLRRAGSIGF